MNTCHEWGVHQPSCWLGTFEFAIKDRDVKPSTGIRLSTIPIDGAIPILRKQ